MLCKSAAPDPGDCGHVGDPSLRDHEAETDTLAAFEYIYRGFAAVGLHLGSRGWPGSPVIPDDKLLMVDGGGTLSCRSR